MSLLTKATAAPNSITDALIRRSSSASKKKKTKPSATSIAVPSSNESTTLTSNSSSADSTNIKKKHRQRDPYKSFRKSIEKLHKKRGKSNQDIVISLLKLRYDNSECKWGSFLTALVDTMIDVDPIDHKLESISKALKKQYKKKRATASPPIASVT